MTDCFTRYSKSPQFDTISSNFPWSIAPPACVIHRLFISFLLALLVLLSPPTALAGEGMDLIDANIEASEEGYRLASSFSVELSRTLEEALMRGVPLYFTLQVQVSRPRWYWFDEVAIKSTRTFRLSYNLLTERYRVSIDGNLHRNFSRLDDMLALLRRPGRWVIADSNALTRDAVYTVSVQFGLDISQLPKPIQVSAMSNNDWRLSSGWSNFNYKAEGK
jgi:hypothetical protein